MSTLSPFETYFLANTVYAINGHSVQSIKENYELANHPNFPNIQAPFNASSLNSFQAHSGINFLPAGLNWLTSSTGFGFLAQRKKPDLREFVLVTRGTDIVPDWLTDAKIGISRGPTGHIVHDGFNDTFKSYKAQLETLLKQVGPPPATVHCVGHSLGGALANLNAALLIARGYKVHLYTLGSPRVGHYPFVQYLEKNMTGQIHRVANRFDPVTMVPVFPFMHASVKEDTYLVSAGGTKINFEAHSTDPSKAGYAVSMNHPSKTWSDLQQPLPRLGLANGMLDIEIKAIGGGALFSAQVLAMIGQAICKLVATIGGAALLTTQRFFYGAVEATDRLAEILTICAHQTLKASKEVESILSAMLHFIGRGTMVRVEVTIQFTRWVLNQLLSEINAMATRAITRR
jgi:triacylglycerol lipase